MTYTFYPLATVDTLNSHTGFYFIAAACAVIAVMALVGWLSHEEGAGWAIMGILVFVCIAAAISRKTGGITVYKNEQVTGTLVGFQAEGFRQREGKSTAEYHYTYVIYEVPEGQVMLRACGGCVYPQRAILYKN